MELIEPRSPRLARWFAALASANEAERGDAAESPPDEATDEQVAEGLVPLLDALHLLAQCAEHEAIEARRDDILAVIDRLQGRSPNEPAG